MYFNTDANSNGSDGGTARLRIYDSGIVILKIASKDLDLSKLHDDSNVQEDDSDTYEYHGQIPWSKIKI